MVLTTRHKRRIHGNVIGLSFELQEHILNEESEVKTQIHPVFRKEIGAISKFQVDTLLWSNQFGLWIMVVGHDL